MRRSTSLILLAAFAAIAQPQAFGRFGYGAHAKLPDIVVDQVGFVAKSPTADVVRFDQPLPIWKAVATSEFEQVVLTEAPPGSPVKLRFSLLLPGAAMYFDQGIRLRVRSTASPYLTWGQGSVSANVPTPDVSWIGLSFQDKQPAWILGFPDGPSNLTVKGRPGDWTIENTSFKGWVRIGLPQTTDQLATNSAAALGELAKQCAKVAGLFTRVAPIVEKVTIKADLGGVLARWQFDRPGACLPPGARFAELGGYPISVRTKTVGFPMQSEEGPVETIVGSELAVYFPVRRIPLGRAVTIGPSPTGPISTVSVFDPPSIAELAFENLMATRDPQTRKTGEDAISDYLQQAAFTIEPSSGQMLPYDAKGFGIDAASANALLMQSLANGARLVVEPNSLLTSILWRMDWNSWRLAVDDPKLARRAGALAALAAALSDEPERRLSAGMLQAGLAAERGIELWRRRYEPSRPEPKLIEPLESIRTEIFGLRTEAKEPDPFAVSLVSPIRYFGDAALELGADFVLKWSVLEPKPGSLPFVGDAPIAVSPLDNLAKSACQSAFGVTEFRFTPAIGGMCSGRLDWPKWATPIPPRAPTPRYSEPIR